MSTHLSKVARLAGTAAAAVLIAACGTESGDPDAATEPSSTPSASETTSVTGLPLCSEVWVDGQDLPLDYKACEEGGEKVKPEKQMCGFGRPMVTHAGRYYAMPGNRINDMGDLESSEQYQEALSACLG